METNITSAIMEESTSVEMAFFIRYFDLLYVGYILKTLENI